MQITSCDITANKEINISQECSPTLIPTIVNCPPDREVENFNKVQNNVTPNVLIPLLLFFQSHWGVL